MDKCIFCQIIAGQTTADIVYRDNQVVVFKDIHPKAAVHLLVVPQTHIEHLNDCKESHAGLLAHMLLLLPKLAEAQGLKHGFRTVINTGAGGGQEVAHLHFHLLGGRLPSF